MIVAEYNFGSFVYGTNHEKSDHDKIVVVDKYENIDAAIKLYHEDTHLYTVEEFMAMLDDHKPHAVESFYLPPEHIIIPHVWDFTLNVNKLRHSFSKVASNSFVKAKKKFTVEKDYDPYIGKKSLFHSIRLIMFGIELAKNNRIIYDAANIYYEDIMKAENWDDLNKKYRQIYNNLSTELRKVAPK